jgi:hypothetical protein
MVRRTLIVSVFLVEKLKKQKQNILMIKMLLLKKKKLDVKKDMAQLFVFI